MKTRRLLTLSFIGISLLSASISVAQDSERVQTDNKSSAEERLTGTVYVKTPKPQTDVITLSSTSGGESRTLQNMTDTRVPVGSYSVLVKMDGGATFSQNFKVNSTERYEVIVPGYGNIRFNGNRGEVVVNQAGTQNQVAVVKAGEVRTLPSGNYDLIIKVDQFALPTNGFTIVSNTTRDVNLN